MAKPHLRISSPVCGYYQWKNVYPTKAPSVAIEADKEFPVDMSADFGRLDAVIVEVSSYKQHSIDGVELNAHMVAGLAKKAEADYRFIIEGRTEQLADGHLLKPLNVCFTSQQDLEDNLLYIRNSLNVPVITVDHLFTLRGDGSRVPAREKLTKMLEQVEITHKIPFYSTENTIVSHGTQSALADQNHYNHSFEPIVGQALLSKILTTLPNP